MQKFIKLIVFFFIFFAIYLPRKIFAEYVIDNNSSEHISLRLVLCQNNRRSKILREIVLAPRYRMTIKGKNNRVMKLFIAQQMHEVFLEYPYYSINKSGKSITLRYSDHLPRNF